MDYSTVIVRNDEFTNSEKFVFFYTLEGLVFVNAGWCEAKWAT